MMKIRSAQCRTSAAIVLTAAGILFVAGCARIADPQPPVARMPNPAADLAATQNGNSVRLQVTLPEQNTDGSTVAALQSVEIFRCAEDLTMNRQDAQLAAKEFLALAERILSIPASRLQEYRRGNILVIQDAPQAAPGADLFTQAFRYAVLFANSKGQAAGLSNQARIRLMPIPPPPEEISAAITETAIQLKWTPPLANMDASTPPRIAGYHVYRADRPGALAFARINNEPLRQAEFRDPGIEFDKTYFYAVSTIGNLRNPFAESLRSRAIEVTVRDVFAPTPPGDFNALFENGQVILIWTPSSSSDVAGYRIFREDKDKPGRAALQEELVSGLSYRDKRIEPNRRYEYILKAVDARGNESEGIRATADTW